MDGNDSKLMEMAARIREMREIIGYSISQMAELTGVSESEYASVEAGKTDPTFNFLHQCAIAFGVDINALLEGHSAHLSGYLVTRAGQGPLTAREPHMEIRNQAAMFQNRLGTPYWVTYKFDQKLLDSPIATTTHAGQEFDIVLKGAMKIRVGNHTEILQEGDSIFYRSSTPHGMIAADKRGLTFLAMVMAGKDGDSHLGLETIRPKTDRTPLIVSKYIDALEDERRRIASYLQDIGYYQFNKEYIRYDVDSSVVDKTVNVQMNLAKFRRNNNTAPSSHPQFIVRSVNYDTVAVDKVRLRASVVEQNTAIKAGELYNASHLRQTYNNFSRLQAVRYTSIHFDEIPDSGLLDCHIQLQKQKINSLQFQPEGTNTAGDFGAAASLTYQNRNMFRGSEVFSITPRVAYEAISQLEGYKNEDYVEYGVESSLTFPRILFPFIPDRKFNVQNATSEISVSYNLQNRPEFHRRLFNAGWRYRWSNTSRHTQYKLDLIDINYLWMPWISDTFKHDYIDSVSNRNVLLRYNYEDLLVMRIGFGYTWSNHGNTWRFNVETAGNVLSALTSPLNMKQNEDGDYKFLGIAFSQYVKGDFEYSHLIQIDEKNNLVLHGRLGIAYPYGNSKMLPFEKRYFSGGANSLRGWSVRALGPGGYKGKDGRIDFINQTGDLRLDLNAELRSMLFWKFQSAVFIDAGNIWTLREYADQPEGQFHFNTFLKQIAANYGVGLRLNLDYFMVRLDLGVKAINPVYNTTREHFPIIHPSFKRDLALHFAVGMPF